MSKKPRSPKDARDRYIKSFQKSLACVGRAVWGSGKPPEASSPDEWTLFLREPLPLSGPKGPALFLTASQAYHTYFDDERGEYRCKTDQYAYRLIVEPGLAKEPELLMWHWHPKSKPLTPHTHVRATNDLLGRSLHKLHIPSGRVLFEEVLLFLMREMKVKATRSGAREQLENEIKRVKRVWTWA